MFDDGSRIEAALAGNFVQRDPYAYRSDQMINEVKAAFGVTSNKEDTSA
jgi:hypothetical protein